jgi:hypothetical protein
MLSRTLLPFGSLIVTLMIAAPARSELIKVSPFLPPQSASATPTSNAPLQYMGWIDNTDGRLYRIVDPAQKKGVFLKVGERDTNLDVSIKQHDDDHDTVTIEHGGQTLTLAQHEAKVLAGAMGAQMIPPPPMPMPMPNVSPAVTQSVVLNPTQADEQKRLEAVAAEVARRRALREQAQQQAQQNAGVQQPVNPNPPTVTRQDLQQQMMQQYPQPGQNQPGQARQRANQQNR